MKIPDFCSRVVVLMLCAFIWMLVQRTVFAAAGGGGPLPRNKRAIPPQSQSQLKTRSGADIAPQATLRFSHATHYQQNISCETCHPIEKPEGAAKKTLPPDDWMPLVKSPVISIEGQAEPIRETTDFARPPEKLCLQCHGKTRQKSDCRLCHFGKPAATTRTRTRVRFGARFPHEAHAATDCLDCHPNVGRWETLDGVMQDTSMDGCLTCHNGSKVKKNCRMCHAKTPWPQDHVRNYETKHGIPYRANPQRCYNCHQDNYCTACHTRKPRSHTLAWVSHRHGITAQVNPDKCQACHSNRETCRRCHKGMY